MVGGNDQTIRAVGEQPIVDAQNSTPEVMAIPIWQTAGIAIQRSLDGGRTWTTEFTAPRAVLAGSTPSIDAGWFVGIRGLVVRRTGSTWSLATAPADVDIVAVQATDDRNATIRLADGRAFVTTDGGTTWSTK